MTDDTPKHTEILPVVGINNIYVRKYEKIKLGTMYLYTAGGATDGWTNDVEITVIGGGGGRGVPVENKAPSPGGLKLFLVRVGSVLEEARYRLRGAWLVLRGKASWDDWL